MTDMENKDKSLAKRPSAIARFDPRARKELIIRGLTALADVHDADFYFFKGEEFRLHGDSREAISSYERAIRLEPKHEDVLFWVGYCYLDENIREYERARVIYEELVGINPQLAEAYYNRGVAYDKLGNHQQAIKDFSKAIELNPQLAEAYDVHTLIHDEVYVLLNDMNLRNSIRRDLSPIWFNLHILGRHDEAEVFLQKQMEKINAPKQAIYCEMADYILDKNLIKHGKKQAIEWLNSAIRIDPEYIPAYQVLGKAYCEIGDYVNAEKITIKSIKLISDKIEDLKTKPEFRFNEMKLYKEIMIQVYSNLAKIYSDRGDRNTVTSIYNQLLDTIGDDVNHSVTLKENLAIMFEKIGELERAITYYCKAGHDYYWDAFRLAAKLSRTDVALELLEKFITEEISMNASCELRDEEDAQDVTFEEFQKFPDKERVLAKLIVNYEYSINRDIVELVPYEIVLGRCYEEAKRFSEASGVYKRCLKRILDKVFRSRYILDDSDYLSDKFWKQRHRRWNKNMFDIIRIYIEKRLSSLAKE